MSTKQETVQYVLEQLEPLDVRARAMFGEYCLYCDDKVVALICDNTVFLKPTAASDDRGLREGPAYAGSKDFRVIDGDLLDDPSALKELIQATARALPKPKPRKARAAGRP